MKKLMIALALAFAVVGGAIVAPPLPIGTSPPAQAPPAAVALPQIADFAYCRRSVGYKYSEDPEGRCSAGAGPPPDAHRARPSSHAVDVSAAREAGYAAVLRGICQRRNDEGFA